MRRNGFLVALISWAMLACVVAVTYIATSDAETAHAARTKFFDAQELLKKYEERISQEEAATKSIATYTIIKETYIVSDDRMDVAINYPQISNLGDDDRQQAINKLLKKEALQILAIFSESNDRGLIMAIHYKIAWQSDKLLSVQYTGMDYVEGAAHPNHEFYTTNIDMTKGVKLRLQDLVTIDENFVAKFRSETIKTVSPHPGALSGKEIFIEHTPFKTVDDMIAIFNDADIIHADGRLPGTYCYFTPDSFGISEGVAFAIGGHAEFEVKYVDLAEYIKADNPVWKDFFPDAGK